MVRALTMKRQLALIPMSLLLLCLSFCEAQIPSVCVDEQLLSAAGNRRCCPNYMGSECGVNEGRGRCVAVGLTRDSSDPRENWPAYYFTHVCECNEEYGGVDCGSCAYGRYPHNTCDRMSMAPRKSFSQLSDSEWNTYFYVLGMLRAQNSSFRAVVNGQIQPTYLKYYDYFVWIHYLVAKDSEPEYDGNVKISDYEKKDFAHESTGFLTWHRQMLLWLEWEAQQLLRNNASYANTYQDFRLPFWDWTSSDRMVYFTEKRLGVSNSNNVVQGNLFSAGWSTICWHNPERADGSECDPTVRTAQLRRCPRRSNTLQHSNPCGDPTYWPTVKTVQSALDLSDYDTLEEDRTPGRYSACPSRNGFRSFLEGFDRQDSCDGNENLMCSQDNENTDCFKLRTLHNRIHVLLGAADIAGFNDESSLYIPGEQRGVMSHVAASPNDPIFINHHAMIDCIFDEWLKKNPRTDYPDDVTTNGHREDDYLVPFIPVFQHSQMFKTASNFGYSCDLSHIVSAGGGGGGGGGGGNSGDVVRPLFFVTILMLSVVAAALM